MKRLFIVGTLLVVSLVIIIPAIVVGVNMGTQGSLRRAGLIKTEDVTIKVYVPNSNKIIEMNLEEYVKGVVAAEMPAEFELEALKAQAVAARTFAVKTMTALGGKGLADKPGADVSADHTQSQAWLSEAQLKEKWGLSSYKKYWDKISRAVDETRGEIIVYQGEPINAVFHSTSGSKTASAKEVWGFDYPYLQSVECNWDTKSPRFHDIKEYTVAELEQRLGADAGVVAAVQNGNTEVAKVLGLTPSGRVDSIRIGSKTMTGLDIREKLELRSTNFTVENKDNKMIFTTIGYGHGVGLCQYGANGMAKDGNDYQKILTYYYRGVEITNFHGS